MGNAQKSIRVRDALETTREEGGFGSPILGGAFQASATANCGFKGQGFLSVHFLYLFISNTCSFLISVSVPE